MNPDDRRKQMADDLIKARQIFLDQPISSDVAQDIGRMVIWFNAISEAPITLYINSNGGSVLAGLDIYDILLHSKASVNGIVYCNAKSMAALVLQACKVRKIMAHATIFLHQHSMTVEEQLDKFEEVAKQRMVESRAREQIIFEIYSHRTGQTVEKVAEIIKGSRDYSARECKELNLVDEII